MFRSALILLFLTAVQGVAQTGPAILHESCLQCHGASTGMSGLRLDSREAMLKGGTRGVVVKPGDPEGSLLFKAVQHEVAPHMPPTGKLTDAKIAILRDWIAAGAEWEQTSSEAVPSSGWWAFKKPVKASVPDVAGTTNPIDAFLEAKMAKQGLKPVETADRRTLVRRATFDLTGLPPSYEEVQAFVDDQAGDDQAWGKLVDRLLASPRYGEKWGRHWLDLVRYGDTAGFEQDPYILEAWRYRDYVIQSFNDDKPYDTFIKEQLAGDELYPDDALARTGTGYFRVNANRDMLFKVEDVNEIEKLTDYVDTTSKVFLALSVGCARCHDHKFDPIPQADFYRMQAVFAPAVNDRVFLEYNLARNYDLGWNSRDFRLRDIVRRRSAIIDAGTRLARQAKLEDLPNGAEILAAFELVREERTPEQAELVQQNAKAVGRISDDEAREFIAQEDRERLDGLDKQLVGLFSNYGPPAMAPGIIDVGREAPRTYIAIRGNTDMPGDEVQPGYLMALGGGDIPEPPLHAKTTYRRKYLAEWIASQDNPLTARVMVNRIWQYHFGEGLVETSSDFGTRATGLVNQELLDWLATEFVDRDWSVKQMHKLIMSSNAYRRQTAPTAASTEKDPRNRYLSHFNRRRLDAEELRDATLAASGELNLEMGGTPVVVPLSNEELYGITGNSGRWAVTLDPAQHRRRSIYLLQRRAFQHPMFQVFDAPIPKSVGKD
ncbi:MAG: PSD1 and planctomycete cytochrome C domain-containing protein [Acidobacteria bacterium]|nr:PSD1 and planctomycete cytochrome C domain-containing protein [Acidobacteriota bacterium]